MTGLALALLLGLAPAERDAIVLHRYLDDADVHAVIDSGLPAWNACAERAGPPPAAGLAVTLVVDGTQGVTSVLAEGGAPALVGCLGESASTLQAPPHDETPVTVRFSLPVVEGRFVSPVRFSVSSREVEPLYLYLPPQLSDDVHRQLIEALGLGSGADR